MGCPHHVFTYKAETDECICLCGQVITEQPKLTWCHLWLKYKGLRDENGPIMDKVL